MPVLTAQPSTPTRLQNYSASTMGITGLPAGQATADIPDRDLRRAPMRRRIGAAPPTTRPLRKTTRCSTTCSGTSASTRSRSAGRSRGCSTTRPAQPGGSTPITLATAVTETAGISAGDLTQSQRSTGNALCQLPDRPNRQGQVHGQFICSGNLERASGPSHRTSRTTGR